MSLDMRILAERNLRSFLKHSQLDGANLSAALNCVDVLVPQVQNNDEPTYADLQSLYSGQCALTDEIAAKLEAGSDKALLARIAELEADLATMNKRYIKLAQGEVNE